MKGSFNCLLFRSLCRERFLLLTSLLVIFCLMHGVVADSSSFPVTIIDDTDNSVTILQEPTRIISLAPSNTEIAYAVGAGSTIVGVTEYCDYPAEAVGLPTVGGFSTVDIEKIVSLDPDLVLASDLTGEEVLEKLARYAIPCIVLKPDSLEGIYHTIDCIGKTTGHDTEAQDLVANLKTRVFQVQEQAGNISDPLKIAHVVWKDPLTISGTGTFQDTLMHRAGGTQAFPGVSGWGTVSLEEFITADPDIILVNSGDGMAGTG
ncbi:MAG: ABC transporter substrate-binding protein, partial [Methanospirillaceae archaeon]|nr:ABC transporter substrate-binding protein [Methanospirillaceae archaeon]